MSEYRRHHGDRQTQWVKAPFGIWELRFGCRAILHACGKTDATHDYSVDEIRCYATHSDWQWITERQAREELKQFSEAD